MSNFECLYLGIVPNISIMPATENGSGISDVSRRNESDVGLNQATSRSSDIQLIDRIDNAQLDGRIPYSGTSDNNGVVLTISKHGLKIEETSNRGGNVIERIPLHMVAQAISYNDGWGRWNVAIKTGQVGKNQFVCHVFQTQNEEESEAICQSIRQIFARVAGAE